MHASLGRWLSATSALGSPLSPRVVAEGDADQSAFPPLLLWCGSALISCGPLLIVLQVRPLAGLSGAVPFLPAIKRQAVRVHAVLAVHTAGLVLAHACSLLYPSTVHA